jgi:class 3 adenylate cyclase
MKDNVRFKEWYSRYERLSCGPAEAEAMIRLSAELDFRSVLQSIRVPTLILCRLDDQVVRPSNSRYLAERIAGARLVELPGADHLFYAGDADPIIREIHEFVTGAPEPEPTDRVLSTVLFTDIVESTERAAVLGDRQWRDILDSHDALVRRHVSSFGGRLIKTTGDGVLATFDGPARAIKCARRLGEDAQQLGITLRAGLHTGEIELRAEDIGGIAVHLAARVMAEAGPSEIIVSSTVKDLVAGSGIEFEDRGSHTLKGVPGDWHLFAARP